LTDLIEEYPRDSLRYEARLLSAVARAELGEVEVPRQQLEQNLEEERLSPESPVFRDSLYVLGELLYRQALREHLKLTEPKPIVGRIAPGDQPAADVAQAFHANQELLNQAIQRLYEAEVRDRRFDNGQRARRAAYLYAEANRLAAFWPTIQANHPDTIDSARRQLERSRNEYLTVAQNTFSALRKELASDVGEQTDLLPWEEGMLRSCYMGIGDTLFDMGEYELAAEAYQTTSQEYLNEPVALEAMLQQSRCYQQLGKNADAQLVFRQAARVLERMPAEMDTRFAETTRYDRANWQSLLTWLQRS
jgi:tetratricopeptide (TPR) repeat protein